MRVKVRGGRMPAAKGKDPTVLEKLSYVISSRQREKVLAALVAGPKTPAQIAREADLRLPHVSRATGQLVRAGLAAAQTPQRRGRLYAASELGNRVFHELAEARGDRVVAPLLRGTHFQVYHRWVTKNHGRDRANALFEDAGIDPLHVDPNGWYPLRSALVILDEIEARFGDGTYETIRRMFREGVTGFVSVRRLLSFVLPLPILIELGPAMYSREFNHGRMEVEVEERRALLKNYDWMSSPARCAAWQGTYEGVLASKGIRGTVRKVACMREGSAYCGYVIEW